MAKGWKMTDAQKHLLSISVKQYYKKNKVSKETREKLSIALRGKPHNMTEEGSRKIAETQRNRIKTPQEINKWRKSKQWYRHSEETKAKISEHNKGKHHTPETIEKLRQLNIGNTYGLGKNKGEKSNLWKGGTTEKNCSFRQVIHNLFEYKIWRREVFARDDFTCQKCKTRGGKLHAHHIKPFQVIINEFKLQTIEDVKLCKELWDANNGQTLCVECHYCSCKDTYKLLNNLPTPLEVPNGSRTDQELALAVTG